MQLHLILDGNESADDLDRAEAVLAILRSRRDKPIKVWPVTDVAETPQQAEEIVALSKDTVRVNTQTKVQAGHRVAITEILKDFDAKNVSSLKPEQLQEFNDKIMAL